MKKSLQTIALSFFMGGALFAQEPHNMVKPCATYEAMEQAFQANPNARVQYEQDQEKLRLATEAYEASLKNTKAVSYTHLLSLLANLSAARLTYAGP